MTEIDFDFATIATIFVAESREILEQIEDAAITLEEHPGDAEAVQILFRGAHSLKGNASCLGLEKITHAAHELEDVLELLRSRRARPDSQLVTAILAIVDVFREALPAAIEGRDEVPAWTGEVLQALRSWGQSKRGPVDEDTDPSSAGAAMRQSRSSERALRVDAGRLDQMMNLTGEMAIARGRLAGEIDRSGVSGSLLDAFGETERLAQQFQELVTSLRLVPVGVVFRPLVRTVRDLAAAEGKKVRLAMEGTEVEVDLSVIEHLRDPLVHMVRNAIDHGIERPEERIAAGKPPEGRIVVSARHEAGSIVVEMTDDGRGFDLEAIGERARHMGADVDSLEEKEMIRLILEPGFSTAGRVTEISGRGVGLDVVRRGVESLRGAIDVDTKSGGAHFTLRLPLTLAIIDGFGVSVEGEAYIIPLPSVLECLDADALVLDSVEGTALIDLRGAGLPVLDLGSCLGAAGGSAKRHVVVVQSGEGRAGLAVDALEGLHQSVIKPLGRPFGRLRDFSGSTILGDGRVALVLDVVALVGRAARNRRMR